MSLLHPNLIAFEAIVKRETVHGAADEIGLTQTGVTQRIRSLEKELEATLFVRSRKGMKLTVEGEALHRYCSSVIDMEGPTIGQIQGNAEKTNVRVGLAGPTSILSSRVTPKLPQLLDQFPFLLLNIIVDDLASRIDYLRSGRVQFAILPPEMVSREMDSKLLKPERFVLAATSKWKGRRTKDIIAQESIIDFNESDETTFAYLKAFDLVHLSKNPRHFINENNALIQLFILGAGYGTLNSELAKPYVDRGDLILLNGGKYSEQQHALTWYPRINKAGYFEQLIKILG